MIKNTFGVLNHLFVYGPIVLEFYRETGNIGLSFLRDNASVMNYRTLHDFLTNSENIVLNLPLHSLNLAPRIFDYFKNLNFGIKKEFCDDLRYSILDRDTVDTVSYYVIVK